VQESCSHGSVGERGGNEPLYREPVPGGFMHSRQIWIRRNTDIKLSYSANYISLVEADHVTAIGFVRGIDVRHAVNVLFWRLLPFI